MDLFGIGPCIYRPIKAGTFLISQELHRVFLMLPRGGHLPVSPFLLFLGFEGSLVVDEAINLWSCTRHILKSIIKSLARRVKA